MKKALLVAGSLLLAVGTANADQIVKPHTFTAGTPAQAEQVNGDFDTVYDQVNKVGEEINIDAVNHRVGIGTATPGAKLHVSGNLKVTDGGGIFAEGPAGTGTTTLPISGRGTRLMWYPEKAAFRVGTVFGDQWDDANVGGNSTAMGTDTIASGMGSTAFGFMSIGSGMVSTAFGLGAMASGDYSTAMGESTTAPSAYETVIGRNNTQYTPSSVQYWATGDRLFVIGNGGMGPANSSDAMVVLKNGNTTVNGNLTANSFFGDGSGLTNINAATVSAVDWSNLGNVPVDLADGDDVNDADADPANEIQSLGLTGNTLAISGGNNVDLSGVGSDTLAELNCVNSQFAQFMAGNGWICVDNPAIELQGKVSELQNRLGELEALLAGTARAGNTITFSGVNVQIDNGTGTTSGTPNGLGNLIVGYNELRGAGDDRSGSHNLVAGANLNYSSFGGIVSGYQNSIGNMYASAVGGQGNTASGPYAVVSGGQNNVASGNGASVSGGYVNNAGGTASAVSGGQHNSASGIGSAVSGGQYNVAGGASSVVSGGWENTANNLTSSVSGGQLNISGGVASAISGGNGNSATGISATVLGGQSNTAASNYQVVGHQIPNGSITSALIADGTIVNSDVSFSGGIYSSKSAVYENTNSQPILNGQCATIMASCNDQNDLPIGGKCVPPGLSSALMQGTEQQYWEDPANAAEYRCTVCNKGTVQENVTTGITCIAVP